MHIVGRCVEVRFGFSIGSGHGDQIVVGIVGVGECSTRSAQAGPAVVRIGELNGATQRIRNEYQRCAVQGYNGRIVIGVCRDDGTCAP